MREPCFHRVPGLIRDLTPIVAKVSDQVRDGRF